MRNSENARIQAFQANQDTSDIDQSKTLLPTPSPPIALENCGNFHIQRSSTKRKRAAAGEEELRTMSWRKKPPLLLSPTLEDLPTQKQSLTKPWTSPTQVKCYNRFRNQRKRCSNTNASADKIESLLPSPPSSNSPPPFNRGRFSNLSNIDCSSVQERKACTGYKPESTTSTAQTIVICAKGSMIESFDYDTLSNILSYVLDLEQTVKPFFKQGMMKGGIKSRPLNDEGIISSENVDLSIFRVNKAFYLVGSDVYYGRNRFSFRNPDACG